MQTVQSVSKSRELWSDSSSEVDWILAQIKDLMQENRYISDKELRWKVQCRAGPIDLLYYVFTVLFS